MAIIINAGTILTDAANGIAVSTDCCCDTSCEYELCDPVSIKYCECDAPGTCIFVDPAVLSGLEPPPPVIEISNTCYQYVEKSLTAIDTFAIDSEPIDCEEPECGVVLPACADDCGASCGATPGSVTVNGIQALVDACPPVCVLASVVASFIAPCGFGPSYVNFGGETCGADSVTTQVTFDGATNCYHLRIDIGTTIWIGTKGGNTFTGTYTVCTGSSTSACAFAAVTMTVT